jgi:hypothetical protein
MTAISFIKASVSPHWYRQGLKEAWNLLMGQAIIVGSENRRREIQKGILLSTDNPIGHKGRIGIGRSSVLQNTEGPKGMGPGDNLAIKGAGFQRGHRMPILERGPIPCNQPQEVKGRDSILDAQYNASGLINE